MHSRVDQNLKSKMLKLLDFYILDNRSIKDVYFLELVGVAGARNLGIGVLSCTQDKAGPLCFIAPNDRYLSQVRARMPIDNRERILGKSLDWQVCDSLGIAREAVSRVWKLSNAVDKLEARAVIADALFKPSTRKDQKVIVLAGPSYSTEIVPHGTIDELLIDVDLKGAA